MPVGGRDERVEQQGFHRRPVSQGRVAQLRRITQGPGQLTRPGVVDGTGQADHQRRAQCLPGRRLSTEHGEDRIPAGPRDRACRVITEVTADGLGVQRAQLDSRCRPEGHLDTTLWPDGVPVLLGAAGHYQLLAGPQRVVDPADRRAPDLFRDLIEPVQDRQDQPGSEQRRSLGWLCPCRAAGAGQGRVVDQELGAQPVPQILLRQGSRTPPRPGTGRGRRWPGGQAGPARAGPSASSCPRPAHRARPAARSAPGPALPLARRPPRPGHRGQPPRSPRAEAEAIRHRWPPASPASPRSRSGMGPPQPRRPAAGRGR